MTSFDPIRRRSLALGLGAALAAAARPGRAEADFPALDRPALRVRSPARSVLLSIAQAGSRLVAVGEHGIVALSDDQGRGWRQALSVPSSVSLTAVKFVDATHGWAVGHGGVILHSADGGEHWARQADGRTLAAAEVRAAAGGGAAQQRAARQLLDEGPGKPLLDLHFFDKDHGVVIGAYNLCFETRDGGKSWTSAMQRIDNPRGLHLYAIAADAGTLYIAGEQGLMLRSRDGGRSFARVGMPYDGSWFTLAVPQPGQAIVAGLRGNVFGSPDDGDSWVPIAGAPPASVVGSAVGADGTLFLANQSGQVLLHRGGAALTVLPGPPLAPLAGVLPLGDGTMLTAGVTGITRVRLAPATAPGNTGPGR